jgi:hypothetical protein
MPDLSDAQLGHRVEVTCATAILARGAILTAMPYLSTPYLRELYGRAADELHDATKTIVDVIDPVEVDEASVSALLSQVTEATR